MSNIKDFSDFAKEPKQIKVGDKLYTVNESTQAYVKFKAAMADEKKAGDDMQMMEYGFELAFGKEKAKELMDTEINGTKIPVRILREIFDEISEAWSGMRMFQQLQKNINQ